MSFHYGAIERKNPRSPNDPPKCYAQIEAGDPLTEDELYEEMSREMGASDAMAKSAMAAYAKVAPRHLRRGRSVPLPGLARINVLITSDGTATPEELARVKKEVSLSIRLDSQLKLEFEHESMMYNGEVTRVSQTP